jgi:hypothetical protein
MRDTDPLRKRHYLARKVRADGVVFSTYNVRVYAYAKIVVPTFALRRTIEETINDLRGAL